LKAESPASRNLLCKRVLSAWGISRNGSRLNSYFESLFSVWIYTKKVMITTYFSEGKNKILLNLHFTDLLKMTKIKEVCTIFTERNCQCGNAGLYKYVFVA
jgi:hypothetical protein